MYDEAKPLPNPALVDELNPFDDITLVPYDNQTLLGTPDRVVQLDVAPDDRREQAVEGFACPRECCLIRPQEERGDVLEQLRGDLQVA